MAQRQRDLMPFKVAPVGCQAGAGVSSGGTGSPSRSVARDAGLSRERLYRALSEDANPSFATVLKVARALGQRLHAEAA